MFFTQIRYTSKIVVFWRHQFWIIHTASRWLYPTKEGILFLPQGSNKRMLGWVASRWMNSHLRCYHCYVSGVFQYSSTWVSTRPWLALLHLGRAGKNMKLGTLFLLSHEIFDLWKGQFTFDHLHQFKSREKSITSVKYLLAAIIHMNKYGKMNVQSMKGKYEALLRKTRKKVFLAGAQFRMKTYKSLTSIILPQSFHI